VIYACQIKISKARLSERDLIVNSGKVSRDTVTIKIEQLQIPTRKQKCDATIPAIAFVGTIGWPRYVLVQQTMERTTAQPIKSSSHLERHHGE
jgi:hypothetical protein